MGPGQRVAVAGAGIAGLAAADALARRGVSVVVLDARDRAGGRIHTVDGVDFGAHCHGTEGNPLTNLARHLGAETIFVGGDSSYTALDYQRFRSFLLAFPESMLALMKVIVERLLHQSRAVRMNRPGRQSNSTCWAATCAPTGNPRRADLRQTRGGRNLAAALESRTLPARRVDPDECAMSGARQACAPRTHGR